MYQEDNYDEETKTTIYEDDGVLFCLYLYDMGSNLKNIYRIFNIWTCIL